MKQEQTQALFLRPPQLFSEGGIALEFNSPPSHKATARQSKKNNIEQIPRLNSELILQGIKRNWALNDILQTSYKNDEHFNDQFSLDSQTIYQYSSAETITGLTPRAYQRSNLLRIASLRRILNLGVCFVLRCFQRLSVPNIATERFSWYQSSQTSGPFNPVLSYQDRVPSSINACSRQRPTCLTHVFHILLCALDCNFIGSR